MNQSPSKHKLNEQQFQDKLNQIVKIIKLKQQICYQIIEYLQQILTNKEEIFSMMFLHDQMSKHKLFLQKMNKKNSQCKTKQKSIHFYYSQSVQLNQNQRGLVRRVSARILQLFQSFNQKVQKYPYFDQQINNHYKLTKPKFVKLINSIDKNGSTILNILQLCNSFFVYLQNKFNDQCNKINKIIQLIENGQIHSIQNVFICDHCKQIQRKSQHVKPQQKISPKNNIQNHRNSSKNIEIKHNQEIHQLKYFSKEKQKINQKLKIMRLQAKTKQLAKKQKTKFANKYYSLYQTAMDLHKGYLIDQLTFIDQKQHKQRIYTEMQLRNKYNSAFIQQYITLCEQKNMVEKVHQKPRFIQINTQQNNLSEDELQNSRNSKYDIRQTADPIIQKDPYSDNQMQIKNIKKQHSIVDSIRQLNSIQYSQTIQQNQQRQEIKSFRITNPNKKTMIPTPKSNPNLFSIKQINQINQSYNFVKINMKNAQNQRARLPDISNRMFSVDQKQKSTKIIDRPQNYIISNNNLLIIKTSLNKPMIDNNKKQQKKKKIEQSNNNRIQNVANKNSDKIQKKGQLAGIPNNVYPLSNPINRNNKKVRRSQSGNKLILESTDKNSLRSLQINYSTSISKKIKNFCEIIAVKVDNNG